MLRKRLVSFASALTLSLSSLFVFAPMAHGAVDACTWNGGGAADNFNDSANWNCSTDGVAVPGNGDSLVFSTNAITAATTLTNDIVGLSVGGISFIGTNTDIEDSYILTGNMLTLTGNISNTSDTSHTVGMTLGAASDISITGDRLVRIGVSSSNTEFALSSNTLTVSAPVYIYHVITGSGAITVGNEPEDFVVLYNTTHTSTFSGTISVSGYLTIDKPSNYPNISSITLGSDAQFASIFDGATGVVEFDIPLILNGDGTPEDPYFIPALEFNLPSAVTELQLTDVTLSQNSTIQTYSTADQKVTITATLNGKALEPLTGSQGVLSVNGQTVESEYLVETLVSPGDDVTGPGGTTEVEDKRKNIYNNQTTENITVNKGGILAGKGKVGNITLEDGGHLAPGESPGCLSSGNLAFVAGAVYDFELGGATVCTEYDQMKVTGTVTLGNGTLSTLLINGYKPVAGQAYTIIENDGADAVSGTFNNLAEGATFTVSGYVLKISYAGGDGNDVVITVQTVPTTPDTGFALLTNNPILTLVSTTALAGIMVILAKKYQQVVRK